MTIQKLTNLTHLLDLILLQVIVSKLDDNKQKHANFGNHEQYL